MSVIIPGSFDPPTLGHLDIIRRAAEEYDEVYVVAFNNPKKNYVFSPEDRVAMLMLLTDEYENVLVSYSAGLVVDYMREHNIDLIVKGYRNEGDLLWESEQAEYNRRFGGYETRLLLTAPEYAELSSTLVREAIFRGEPLFGLVSPEVEKYILENKPKG